MSKSKLKLAIYNYESSILPEEWIPAIDHLDFVLPSSNYSKEVFVESGWSADKCIVLPHGIFADEFNTDETIPGLKKHNKFNFLNISIPHYRKNIGKLLEAYYSEFSISDDVNLILKTSLKKPKLYFECDVKEQIVNAQKKFNANKLPMVTVLFEKYPSMSPLYNSCNAIVSASSSEGFGMPLLEGLASKKIVISPNCTGQKDFLNFDNSLLYEAKRVKAPKEYQYWRPNENATIYMPNIEELSFKMRYAYENESKLLNKFSKNMEDTVNQFSWKNVSNKIMRIYEENI